MRESSGPKDVDADGDEVMVSPSEDASNVLDAFEERLAMGELRKGTSTSLRSFNACTYVTFVRHPNAHSDWEY